MIFCVQEFLFATFEMQPELVGLEFLAVVGTELLDFVVTVIDAVFHKCWVNLSTHPLKSTLEYWINRRSCFLLMELVKLEV